MIKVVILLFMCCSLQSATTQDYKIISTYPKTAKVENSTFINKENKPTDFDIVEYCKLKYPGTATYYYEILNDDTGGIYGYNIFGAFIKEGDSHDGVYGKTISDPHFLNKDGKLIIEGKVFFKKINVNSNSIIVFITPSITLYNFGRYGLNYVVDGFDFYTCNPEFENLSLLFHIDNIQRSKDEKIVNIDFTSTNAKSVEKSVENKIFYFFECGESGSSFNTKGIIDYSGKILFENQFKDISYLKEKGDIAYFLVNTHGNKFGIAKSNGTFLIEPNFELLDVGNIENKIIQLGKIKYQGKYGLINKDYNIVIDPKYKSLQIINDKYAIIKSYNYNSGEYWDFLNLQTKNELGHKIQEINGLIYSEDAGEIIPTNIAGDIPSEIAVKINYKWGFCNQFGKIIIQPKYDFVTSFSEGIAFAATQTSLGNQFTKDNTGFFINKAGIVITTLNKEVSNDISTIGKFSEGLLLYKSRKKGQFGYINSKGQIAIQPAFEEAGNFYFGQASVKRFGTTYNIDKKGNRLNN